ncbi:unnamed protein product [Umbelopsis sp. WA50703]
MELPDFAQNSVTTMAEKSSTQIEWGDHQDFDNEFGDFNQFDAEDDDFGDFAAGTADSLDFEGSFGGPDAYVEVQQNTQPISHDLVDQAPQISTTTDEHDTTDEEKHDSSVSSELNAQESNNATIASLDQDETRQSDDNEQDHRYSHHAVDNNAIFNSDVDDHVDINGNSETERSSESHRQAESPDSPYEKTATDSSIMIKNEPTTEAISANHAERVELGYDSATQSTSHASAPDNDLPTLGDEDQTDGHFRLKVDDERHDNYEDTLVGPKSDEGNEASFPDLKENESADADADTDTDADVSEEVKGAEDACNFNVTDDITATAGFPAVKDDNNAADFEELNGASKSDFADLNEDEDEDGFGDFGDAEATEEFGDFGDVEEDEDLEDNWEISDTTSKDAQVHSDIDKPFVPTELQKVILSANFKKAEAAVSVWDEVLGYLLPLSDERDKSDMTNERETVQELVMGAHESLYPTITWHALTVNTDDDNGIPKVQWRNSRIEKMYLDALNAAREPKIASPPPPSTNSPTVKPSNLSVTSSPSPNVDTPVAMTFQQNSPTIENIVMPDKPVEVIGMSEAQATTMSKEADKKIEEKVTIVPKITTSLLPASDSAPASASSGKDLFHLSSVMSPPLANDHSPPRPVPTRHASSPAIHAEPENTPVNGATAISVAAMSKPKKRHTMEFVPQQARSPSPLSQSFRSLSYSRPLTPTKFATQSQTEAEFSPSQSPKAQLQSSPNTFEGSLGSHSFTERIQSPETERPSMDLEHTSEVSSHPDVSSFPATSPPAMQSEVRDSWLSSNDISFLDTLGGHSVNKPKSKPSSQKIGLGILDLDVFEAANSPAPNSKPSSTTSAWETFQDTRQKRGSGPRNDIFNTKQSNVTTRSTLTKSPPARPSSVRSPSAESTWANPLSPVRSQIITSTVTTSQKSPPVHSQSPPSERAFDGFGDFGDFATTMMQAQPVSSPSSDSRWDVFRSASLSGSLSEWSTELTNPASPSNKRESNASSMLNVAHKENSAMNDDDEFGDFSAAGDDEFGDFGSATTTWDVNQAYQFPSDPSKGWT